MRLCACGRDFALLAGLAQVYLCTRNVAELTLNTSVIQRDAYMYHVCSHIYYVRDDMRQMIDQALTDHYSSAHLHTRDG